MQGPFLDITHLLRSKIDEQVSGIAIHVVPSLTGAHYELQDQQLKLIKSPKDIFPQVEDEIVMQAIESQKHLFPYQFFRINLQLSIKNYHCQQCNLNEIIDNHIEILFKNCLILTHSQLKCIELLQLGLDLLYKMDYKQHKMRHLVPQNQNKEMRPIHINRFMSRCKMMLNNFLTISNSFITNST